MLRSLQPGDVRLIAPSESAILSRIQFPDREAAILYGASGGNSGHSRNHTQLTLGVASVARVSAPSYVEKTLDQVLAKSSVEERLDVAVVVVCVADADKAVRQIRAKKLYTRYKEHVDNGFIQVPKLLFYCSMSNILCTNRYLTQELLKRGHSKFSFAKGILQIGPRSREFPSEAFHFLTA